MANRIPTSSSDRAYVGAVAQDQPIIAGDAPVTRTRAEHKNDRDEAALVLSIDLYMNQQLIVAGTYLNALGAGDSFEESTRATKAFLADNRIEALQQIEAAEPEIAAKAAGKAAALEAAEFVLAENCMNGDTLNIYRRYAPKQG